MPQPENAGGVATDRFLSMRSVVRSLTVVLSFLSLQLSLLGSAAACMSPNDGATGATGGASAMAAMATDGSEHHCNTPERDSHAPAPTQQHCATMIICAFALDAPTSITETVAPSRVATGVLGISQRTPMSHVVAPELPPPRA